MPLPNSHFREVAGVVIELLPQALYRVELDDRQRVVAHAGGGTRRNFVRLIVGDRVQLTLSPRDAGRGRITRRLPSSGV
ncbi:MAG: translation initiation factor IF-1 [Acidobacteria bacterium]|nr:translation initiation factor IF-1 [Acidobacteriota bacterium]MBI3263437.1 translation initiation factor IF-1 [Acidobacteriota bacterium]